MDDSVSTTERRHVQEEKRSRFSKSVIATAIALLGALAFAWGSFQPLDRGLPRYDVLEATSGRLVAHHWGYRSYTIRIWLQGQPRTFLYTEKMGDELGVWHSLCDGCVTTLWTDAADSRPEPFAFQIAVNDRIIRSYNDVKNTWLSDDKLSPYSAIVFAIATLCLASYTAYQWRQLKRPASSL